MTALTKFVFTAVSSLLLASSVVAESDASILARARAEAKARSEGAVRSGYDGERYSGYDHTARVLPEWARADVSQFLSVECFYAWATDDIIDHSHLRCDLYGITVKYGATAALSVFDFDFFVAGRVGYGEDDMSEKYDDGDYYKTDAELTVAQLVIGFDASYSIDERLSVFFGGQVGAGLAHAKIKLNETGERDSNSDSDAGLVFGVGAGVSVVPTEHHSIVVRVDVITSTAQPEVFYADVDTQTHAMLSVGYKCSF